MPRTPTLPPTEPAMWRNIGQARRELNSARLPYGDGAVRAARRKRRGALPRKPNVPNFVSVP